ncbi:hypothetical protein COCON_G00021190 [Conger conger]|uniref:Ig-like domain-containing protein n=1 Tax=Conger conger TaxID=82655 RepID=A0A9Q1DXB1_CONCO|nr:hypothetical protein COCON_G00021190 [Conger conger]
MAKNFLPDDLTITWSQVGGGDLGGRFLQYPSVRDNDKFTAVSHLQVKQSDWNNEKAYQCSAAVPGVPTKEATVQKPKVVIKSAALYLMIPTEDQLKHNKTASFACFASEFSPKELTFTWSKNGKKLTGDITTLPVVEISGNFSASTFLHLSENQWKSGDNVSCAIKHQGGDFVRTAIYKNPSSDCGGIPVQVTIPEPSTTELFLHGRVELKCQITGELGVVSDVDKDVENSRIVTLLAKKDDWANGTKYTCIVMHDCSGPPISTPYSRDIGREMQRPTVFIMIPTERASTRKVTLVCYAKGFYPKEVLFSWFADDVSMDRPKFQTSKAVEMDSLYSAYSQLSVSIEDWEKGTVYGCAVHHESVSNNENRAVVRTIDSISQKASTVSFDMCRSGNSPA